MGRFARSFSRGLETSLTSGNWTDITGGSRSKSGVAVNERNILGLSAVYSCVKVLSETMSTFPLFVYQRQGDNKVRAPDHPVYSLLHDQPNPEMVSCVWRETSMGHLTTWGNAYSEIEFDDMWRPKALWPLLPDRTWPERDRQTGQIIYKTILSNGKLVALPSYRVLHVPGMGFDGLVGYSPVKVLMDVYGMGLATQEYGNRFYSNGARPSGVLTHPKTLSKDAKERLRDSFEVLYNGLSNSHRTMLLEEGLDYKQIGIPPDEAQFIDSRKMNRQEIASIYRVQLHLINDLDNATFSNIEHQSIEFLTMTMLPYCVRFEQIFTAKLLTDKEKKKFLIEHLMDSLIRGDIQSRYDAYSKAINNGWMNPDEARAKENMNPMENGQGKIYRVPVNTMPANLAVDFWGSKIGKGGTPDGQGTGN